jgi:YidC/Oxa1 family membrane protein insertase
MANTKIDWQRNLLLAGMAATVFMLIGEWSDFQDRKNPVVATETSFAATPSVDLPSNEAPVSAEDIPSDPDLKATSPTVKTNTQQKLISVKTDSLVMLIDTLGGDIVKVGLPRHFAQLDTPDQPFVLLNNTDDKTYIAKSGLIGQNGTDTLAGRPTFTVSKNEFVMNESENTLNVDLEFQQDDAKITKRFTFTRGDYLVQVQYLVENQGDATWKANFYGQLNRDSHDPVVSSGGMGMAPFLGAALTSTEENYRKFTFDDIADSSFKETIEGGWVAMVQHYFLSAWVANADEKNIFELKKQGNDDLYLMRYIAPKTEIAPGTSGTITSSFYAGPKDVYRLEEIAPYLDLTVDYGFLWWIAKPIFRFLHFIYSYVGNWGWSIILLTVSIKAVFFHLSATSYRSMAKMRKIQPMMQELKERIGDDKQKMSTELMKLYKKEKVNPLGGCLPILVQMPVFISLYWVLMESVELRHTPFLGWIMDLSVKDPLFILPLVMGLTMWIQQKLNPTPPDPMQAKVMQMMPIVFTFMFLWFPAGLVLYWVVNNTLSIIQQYIITKQIEASDT